VADGRWRRAVRLIPRVLIVAYIAVEIAVSAVPSSKAALVILVSIVLLFVCVELASWRQNTKRPGHERDSFWRYVRRPLALRGPRPGSPASSSFFSFVACAVATSWDWLSSLSEKNGGRRYALVSYIAFFVWVSLSLIVGSGTGLAITVLSALVVSFVEGAYELWSDGARGASARSLDVPAS